MPNYLASRARRAAEEIHRILLNAIAKTAQAWAEEHEETETLEINIPGSNVNVFSEIIERHMRDPGTSIAHWTRYDGTTETLPKPLHEAGGEFAGCLCVIKRKAAKCIDIAMRNDCGDEGQFWDYGESGEDSDEIAVGDLWAYLPEPPEAMQ